MLQTTHQIRVRYGETDPMKYVYYGNYAEYLEVARVELLSEYSIKYLKPAKYDDLLEIKTTIKKLPSVRIEFEYEIYNQANEKLTEAHTTLFFLDAEKQKITKCPEFLINLIKKYWLE